MKKILFALAAFLLVSTTFADVIVEDPDVKPSTKQYTTESPSNRVHDNGYRKILAFGFTEDQAISKNSDDDDFASIHPFVGMVGIAFAEHHSIEITPDDIWLLILDGVRLHVEANRDALKRKFVVDGSDTTINVYDNSLSETSPSKQWMDNINAIYGALYKKLPTATRGALSAHFSTTTPEDQFVSKAMVMAVSSQYYTYHMYTLCGIPKIVIKGELKDWKNLKAHFNQIAKELDMSWWAKQVNPILDEFINVYKKKANLEFWRGIYKYIPPGHYSGAVPGINGWVTQFFPYIKKRVGYPNTQEVLKRRTEWTTLLQFEDFTVGRSSVPVIWHYTSVTKYLSLSTGFWGIYQDPKTKILKTIRGYALTAAY